MFSNEDSWMLSSYHVHSRWSDGEGEIGDFVKAAQQFRLAELGISDHYVLAPDGRQVDWSMPLDAIGDYVESVQRAAGEAGEGLVVRLGVEADYFPENASALRDILATRPFDYVIGSVHFADGFPIDANAENWERVSQNERDEIIRSYWVRIRQMAGSRLFDIAAHLDLTKKFGFRPSVDMRDEICAALNAIAQSGMSVEVNTAGGYAECHEAYPAPWILRGCLDRNIPVLITADAHDPTNLTRGFEDAYRLIRKAGYTEIASYAGRQRVMHTLPGVEQDS